MLLKLLIPGAMPPTVPGVEKIDEPVHRPPQFGIRTRDDEKSFGPRKDTLESFAETADCSLLGSLCAETNLCNGVPILLSKVPVKDGCLLGSRRFSITAIK